MKGRGPLDDAQEGKYFVVEEHHALGYALNQSEQAAAGGGEAVSGMIAAAGSWQASPLGVMPSVRMQLLLSKPAAEFRDKLAGIR